MHTKDEMEKYKTVGGEIRWGMTLMSTGKGNNADQNKSFSVLTGNQQDLEEKKWIRFNRVNVESEGKKTRLPPSPGVISRQHDTMCGTNHDKKIKVLSKEPHPQLYCN